MASGPIDKTKEQRIVATMSDKLNIEQLINSQMGEAEISPSQGVWKARNDAIRYSTGEYLLLQDSDDLAVPQRAEIQMQALESNSEINSQRWRGKR